MRCSLTKQLRPSPPPPPLAAPAAPVITAANLLPLLAHHNANPHPHGLTLHTPIIKLGLHSHLLLTNHLLSLYSKLHLPHHTLNLFSQTQNPDTVSWTAAISACASSGLPTTALHLFAGMLPTHFTPNNFTLSSAIRAASILKALRTGQAIHSRVIKHGYESNAVICTALTNLYIKCGKMDESDKVFNLIGCRDTVSWTTIIASYVNKSGGMLRMYKCMVRSGVTPNEYTFAKVLPACGRHSGVMVHAHMVVFGVGMNLVVKTALVDMYSKCECMDVAMKVLRVTPECDVTLWTAVVTGYTHAKDYQSAIEVFRDMAGNAGVSPNAFTYAGVIHACTGLPVLALGRQVHCRVVKTGLDRDASVGNALVDMYNKVLDNVDGAMYAFEAIAEPNVVSWTTRIAGLVRHGRDEEAMEAFTEMLVAGLQPNSFTLSTILCSGSMDPRKVHACVLKTMSSTWNLTEGNSLVDAYVRIGRADDGWKVAERMPMRDVCTYTSLAKGYNQIGRHREALGMIARMREEGVAIDGFSLACFISASAGLVVSEPGKQLHCYALKSGLHCGISVLNSLVDLYGKCGSIVEARRVFDSIQEPNVVSWNGLISVLASNGHVTESLSAFEDMRMAGMLPDSITFLVVLHACNHGGLVDMGVDYFNLMKETHCIEPQLDHYICLVDMLGRAGRLEAANCAIETMPFQPDALIYKTLLSSCKLHSNLVLGESMARRALEIDPSDPAVYVLLAGIYDDAGKLQWAEQTRRMMKERGVRKWAGQSWMGMSC